MAGYALDLRISDGLDDDVVADPVDADLADLLGKDGPGGREGRRSNQLSDQNVIRP